MVNIIIYFIAGFMTLSVFLYVAINLIILLFFEIQLIFIKWEWNRRNKNNPNKDEIQYLKDKIINNYGRCSLEDMERLEFLEEEFKC